MAFAPRRPASGAIFHSDRGCQYASKDYAALARANGVILSVSRKGECWDNAVAQSFFATIKREVINDRPGPREPGCTGPSSTTSRAGITAAGSTPPSATSAPPNTS